MSTRFVCGAVVVACFFFALFKQSYSIRCYECNSHTDKNCSLKPPPDYLTKNCSNNTDQNKYVICRKISQQIDFEVNGLQPDSRVIRSCAYESQEKNKCYQRSGFGGRQEVCACDQDLCNASNMIKFNTKTTFACIVFSTILSTTFRF